MTRGPLLPSKNGSNMEKSSYRGICVRSVFTKLQDSLITSRGESLVLRNQNKERLHRVVSVGNMAPT